MACFRNDLHQVLSNKKIRMPNILKHAMLDIYSASSLKKQSKDRHISQLSQIMLTSKPISLYSYSLTLCDYWRSNTYQPGIKSKIYCTRGYHINHHTTEAVCTQLYWVHIDLLQKKYGYYWIKLLQKKYGYYWIKLLQKKYGYYWIKLLQKKYGYYWIKLWSTVNW